MSNDDSSFLALFLSLVLLESVLSESNHFEHKSPNVEDVEENNHNKNERNEDLNFEPEVDGGEWAHEVFENSSFEVCKLEEVVAEGWDETSDDC